MSIKLSDAIMEEVLNRVAEGMDAFQICGWLTKVHGITVTDMWVRRKLARVREERKNLIQDVLREKLRSAITHDLDHVEQVITRAFNDEIVTRREVKNAKAGAEKWTRLNTVARGHRNDLMRALELRMKLAGADMSGGAPKPLGVVMLPAEQD